MIAIKLYLLKNIIIYRMNFDMIMQQFKYIKEYQLIEMF